MKNSRLFKVFVSLFMVVGMLFNVRIVKAIGGNDIVITFDSSTQSNDRKDFGEQTVGSSVSTIVHIRNNSQEAAGIKFSVSATAGGTNIFSGPQEQDTVTIPANNEQTYTIQNSSLPSIESDQQYYETTWKIYDTNSSSASEIKSFNVAVTVKKQSSPSGCSIAYDSNADRFNINCNSDVFKNNSTATNYSLKFKWGENMSRDLDMTRNITVDDDYNAHFTYKNLGRAQQGQYIPGGTYSFSLSINGQSYDLSGGPINVNQINQPAPSFSTSFDSSRGIILNCAEGSSCEAYFQYIEAHQHDYESNYKRFDQGGQLGGINSGVTIYQLNGSSISNKFMFPDIGGARMSDCIHYSNGQLVVDYSELSEQAVSDGSYYVEVNAPNGYGQNTSTNQVPVNMQYANKTISEMHFNYDTSGGAYNGYPSSFSITSDDAEFLFNIRNVDFTNQQTLACGGGYLNKGDDYTKENVITKSGDNYILTIPMKCFSGIGVIGTGNMTVSVMATGYTVSYSSATTNTVTLNNNPYRRMPTLKIKVVGQGFIVTTENSGDASVLKDISELDKDFPYYTPGNAMLNGTATDEAIHITNHIYEYEYQPGPKSLLIKARYSQVVNEWNITNEDAEYTFVLVDPIYENSGPMGGNLSLAPLRLYEEADKGNSHTLAELEALDGATRQVKNINISSQETDYSGYGVAIAGEAAGSIASNKNGKADYCELNYSGDAPKAVSITTGITVPTEDALAPINAYISENGQQATDVKFNVDIQRDSFIPDNTYKVTELPYEACVSYNVPKAAPAGYHYVLLREHEVQNPNTNKTEKKIDELKCEISGTKGISYTDQFSTFQLVLVKDAPVPAPSSDSSKKSTTTKTDNVVTCQMAGYPANYAWNESAKACQPGYINNNGVFVSTAGTANGKRLKAVNTWDNGLGGSITALIASTMAALFAAYALRKWN